MKLLPWLLMFCTAVLWAAAVAAKTDASINRQATEARWQSYASTAQQTQPALDFPYAHCFSRAAAAHELPETLLLAVARGESNFEPRARSSGQCLRPDADTLARHGKAPGAGAVVRGAGSLHQCRCGCALPEGTDETL